MDTSSVGSGWPGEAHGSHLVYVGTGFGGRLHVADAPLLCAGLGLLGADLPPVLQVRLVPHQQEGNVLVLLHTKDLLPEAGTQRNRGHKICSSCRLTPAGTTDGQIPGFYNYT